jgi:phosphohistidine phosphatase SixA
MRGGGARAARAYIGAVLFRVSSEPPCCRKRKQLNSVHIFVMRLSPSRLFAALVLLATGSAGAQSPASTFVVVVRHAEKATDPAADPPLTAAGEARAQALADVLADARVEAVISTPYKRTMSTGAPIAAKRGLTTEVIPVTGGTPAHATAVAASIREKHRGQTVLVVEHSNTVAAIIKALGGPALADLCDQQYSSLFVLEMPASGAPKLVRSTYGAADPPGAASCGSH